MEMEVRLARPARPARPDFRRVTARQALEQALDSPWTALGQVRGPEDDRFIGRRLRRPSSVLPREYNFLTKKE